MAQYRVQLDEFTAWQQPVSNIQGTPPASPVRGDRYIVAPGATSNWAGHDNTIAWYDGVAWMFDIPTSGWQTYIRTMGLMYRFDGTNWGLPSEATDDKVKADSSDTSPGPLTAKVDNSTIEVNTTAHQLRVKDQGITTAKIALLNITKALIASDVAGYGMVKRSVTGELDVVVDAVTIEIVTNALRVKAGSIADSHLASTYIKANGTVPFSANQSMGSFSLVNVANPINANDAVNKNYVDGLVNGVSWKKPVTSILTTPPGSPTNGMRVLVGPTAAGAFLSHNNEIATYSTTPGSWSFEAPSDNWTVFSQNDDQGFTYDSTSVDVFKWVQFTGTGQINAGTALNKVGNTLNVGIDNTTIEANSSNNLRVKDAGITAVKLNSDVVGIALAQNITTKAHDVQVDNATIKVVSNKIALDATIKTEHDTAYSRRAQFDSGLKCLIFTI